MSWRWNNCDVGLLQTPSNRLQSARGGQKCAQWNPERAVILEPAPFTTL